MKTNKIQIVYSISTFLLVAAAVFISLKYGSDKLIYSCAGIFIALIVVVSMGLLWYLLEDFIDDKEND